MANIQHKDITESNQHEPKGVSVAASNTVYVATGAGTGVWKKLPNAALDNVAASKQDSGAAVSGAVLEANGSGAAAYVKRMFRYNFNVGTLAAVAANTTVEQVINVAGIVASTDDVVQIAKPSNQAGLLVVNGRIVADGQVVVQFANLTAAAITPTASEIYTMYVWRR